uniref:Skp1_POZ domain-containing protein n=1 Tax=Panagrellus redivivus TaxID=6233 RepID=A0A7E4W3T5_PANRE
MAISSTIKVITSDNCRFDVETKLLVRSGQLERLLANHPDVDDLGNVHTDAQPLRLRRTDGKVFKAIIDWLDHHRDEDFSKYSKDLAIFERTQMMPPPDTEKEPNLTKSLVNYDDSEDGIDATADVHVVPSSTDDDDCVIIENANTKPKKPLNIMTMPLIFEKDGILEVNPKLFEVVDNLYDYVAADFEEIVPATAGDISIPAAKDHNQTDLVHEVVHCMKALQKSNSTPSPIRDIHPLSAAQEMVESMRKWCEKLGITADQTHNTDGENVSIGALFNRLHASMSKVTESTNALEAAQNNLPKDVPFDIAARLVSVTDWDVTFFGGLEKAVLLSLIVTSKTLDIFELHKRACQYVAAKMGDAESEILAFLTL